MHGIVHVLIEHYDHEGDEVLGVFSTHEKATDFAGAYRVSMKGNRVRCHLFNIDGTDGSFSRVGEPVKTLEIQ